MFTRQEKFLLAILACIQFSHIVDFMIMMPLGPQLMRIFAITPQQFGLLVSTYTLSAGISGFLSSMYIDRFDRKTTLIFFYVGFGLGTVACGMATSYVTLVTARSITGVFGGVLGSLVIAIIGDLISLDRRGTAIGITSAAFSVASVLGVPIGLFLANQFNWHAPFYFLGIVSLIACFGAYYIVPNIRGHLQPKGEEKNPFDHLFHIFKSPNLIMAIFFMATLIFGQFTIIPFLSPSLVANAGLSEAQLPLIYLVGGAVSIFASPAAGRLSDKYGRKKIFVISAIASMIPILIITHLGTNPVPIILLCIALFFLCTSGRWVPAMATISAAATPSYRGAFMSVVSAVQQLSAAAASYFAGLIVIEGNGGRLLNYEYVGYIAVAFSVFAIFFGIRVKETS